MPFTVGVIVLSAKMAKADGSVAADEVKAFKEAFKVSPAEMKQVASVFNSAKRDTANFEECAEQLVTVFKGNRKLLEMCLTVSSTSPKPMRKSIRKRSSSLGRSPSSSALPSASSTQTRLVTWLPPSAILMTCSA